MEPASRSGRTLPMLLTLLPLLLVVCLVAGLFIFNPALRGEFAVAWGHLFDGETDALREWLLSYGAWAPVLSVLLQVSAAIFPPGPQFLLGIVNAMAFGLLWGGLLTLLSQLLAAVVCFGIARIVGRPGVIRIVDEEKLKKMDSFMARRGMLAVFLGRLIPFINPDLVSYAAGVTGIRWLPFLLAVGAGAIPSTLFYSVVGVTAVETTGWVVVMVGVATLAPLVLLVFLRKRLPGRWTEPLAPDRDSSS
ncbi:MAG: TVP38/TMEM64 family protein [Gemmatimonadota bacterium]